MKTFCALTLFAATALCAPTDGVYVNKGIQSRDGATPLFSAATIEACKAAKNCEVYDTPNGQAIRFVPGQEPGTAAYNETFASLDHETRDLSNLVKRSSYTTNVHMGSNVLNYGTTNPADAVHSLWDACQYSSCDSTPISVATKVQGCYNIYGCDQTLTVTAFGQYNGWEHRNNLVTAIWDISQQGQKWTKVRWRVGSGANIDYGEHWEGEQSGYFSVNVFSGDFMVAWMQTTVAHDSQWDAGCQRVYAALAAAAGALSGIAGGFFGALSNTCG